MGFFRTTSRTSRKAFTLFYQGSYAEALPLFGELAADAGAPALERVCHAACIAHVTGDPAELHRQCEQATDHIAPDVLLRIKGSVLFDIDRTNRRDEGLPLMRQAVRLNPSIKNMLVLASRLDKIGRNEEAIGLYEAVLCQCPHHVPALVGCACAEAELGKPERAKERLAAAIALCPHDAEAHYELAAILLGEGRLPEALWHFRKSARLDHCRPAQPWAAITEVLCKMGKTAEAAKAARKAIKPEPECRAAHRLLQLTDPPPSDGLQARGTYVPHAATAQRVAQ